MDGNNRIIHITIDIYIYQGEHSPSPSHLAVGNSPPRLDVVQPTDNDLEPSVEAGILILNPPMVRLDVHPRAPLVDEFGSHHRLGLPDVLGPEEELTVEVGHVDGV